MNKKSQNQNSSDRILKSKYLEKQKPKFPSGSSTLSKKVMLTDLCPQQKLKIGELIKVNESRRQQILELTQQMNEIHQKFTLCHSRLLEIEKQFQAKQDQCSQLIIKVEKLQQKSIELDVTNNKLVLQNKEMKENLERVISSKKENRSCQTQTTEKTDFSTQTKKGKTKCKQIQVQQDQLLSKQKSKSKYHTKSYERLVNQRDRSLKNSFSRSQNQIGSSQNASLRRNEEEQDNIVDEQNREGQEFLVEQRLNDLAKQWLQLKQKKVSHLKAQYEHSKANFFKEQPRQFTCQDLITDDAPRQTQQAEQIDQSQLNNLLKSKNFSASRLLTSKGLMNESQNSRNCSVNQKNDKQSNLRPELKPVSASVSFKSPKLNISISQEPSKKIDKTPIYDKYSHAKYNFYESDFMDLVDSLND